MSNTTYLVHQIQEAAQAYYDGSPTLSDKEFDGLVEQLRALKPDHKLLSTPGWGYKLSGSHLTEVKHKFQVGSLSKLKHQDFLKKKQLPFGFLFVVSLKLDGGSAVAYYDNGNLVNVVSRGDGNVGLDITKNLMPGGTVPTRIRRKGIQAVRGEVIITLESLTELGGANARNVAIGLSQSIHKSDEELKHLKFVAYDVPLEDSTYGLGKDEVLCNLEDSKFLVVPNALYKEQSFFNAVNSGDLTITNTERLRSRKLKGGLPIDGLVLTDNVESSHRVYPSIAYKFDDETAETKVIDIVWKASRTGRIVPVAEVEPVTLSGATISRVTMNNWSFLKVTQAGPGAVIEIVRSNMVIPRWVNTVTPIEVNELERCPCCNSNLTIDGRDLVCSDQACEAKNAGGRKALWDMVKPDGIGPAIIEQFEDHSQLYSFQDILMWAYSYKPSNNSATESLVKMMVLNIRDFRPTFGQVLAMANIKQVGQKVQAALDTLETFQYLQVVKANPLPKATWKDCMNRTAWDNLNTEWHKVVDLLRLFTLEQPINPVFTQSVKVCLTGALSKPRAMLLKEWLVSGITESSISSCDVLIADAPSSSGKYITAIKRKIPIMTETEFIKQYLG